MAPPMSTQSIRSDSQTPPTPQTLGLIDDTKTPYPKEIIFEAKDCLDIHNATPTEGDPFTLLNGHLDESKLAQNPRLRSSYGPDFHYRHMDYPCDDSLLYRWGEPLADAFLHDAYLSGLTDEQLEYNHFHAHQLALAHDHYLARNMGLLPDDYEKIIQHCVPAPSMMALPLNSQNNLNDSASPNSKTLDPSASPKKPIKIKKPTLRKRILKRKASSAILKTTEKCTATKDETPIIPPNHVIDYFTGQPRRMRMWENLRGRFERYIQMPIEERPQGVHWEEGDSDMDFSEWQEANRTKKRMRRARKARVRRSKAAKAESV